MVKDCVVHLHRKVQRTKDKNTQNIYKIHDSLPSIVNSILAVFGAKPYLYTNTEVKDPKVLIEQIDNALQDNRLYIEEKSQEEIAALFLQDKKTQALDFGKKKVFTRIDSDNALVTLVANQATVIHFNPTE